MSANIEHEAATDTSTEVETFQSPLFRVVLINDDFTPMEFVIEVLKQLFSMPQEQAEKITMQVHNEGKGVCGVFTREIAEAKVASVNNVAEHHEHPLMCIMEPNG